MIARAGAGLAPRHLPGAGVRPHPALRTEPAHQPLIHDSLHAAREQVWLNAHVEQPTDDAARRTSMQRADDEVAREGRLDSDGGRLAVAHLANHDNFRILPEQAAQAAGEIKLGARPYLRLAYPLDHLLDGIFDGNDVPARPGSAHEMAETGIDG